VRQSVNFSPKSSSCNELLLCVASEAASCQTNLTASNWKVRRPEFRWSAKLIAYIPRNSPVDYSQTGTRTDKSVIRKSSGITSDTGV
jgi:hypothetical protein